MITLVTSDRTGGNAMSLCQGKLRLDIRKRDPWGGWALGQAPHGSGHSTRLTEFKRRLDDVCGYM